MNMYNLHFVAFRDGRPAPFDVEVKNQMHPNVAAAMSAAAALYPLSHSGFGAEGYIIQENRGPIVGSWFANPNAKAAS